MTYDVELDSTEDEALLAALLARVDEVAEIPRAVRAGATVVRGHGNRHTSKQAAPATAATTAATRSRRRSTSPRRSTRSART